MLAALLYSLIFVFSQKTLAERPSRLRVSLAADEDSGEKISEITSSAEARASGAEEEEEDFPGAGCQQEEALLAALRDLGLSEKKLDKVRRQFLGSS